VVSPVYKAEGCLHELYTRLRDSLETITPNFEIILVEDCGGDRSWEIIQELATRDSRVKGIQFSRNFGQHYGITAGLDHCNGDWIVVLDCDLQDRPEEIPRLYAKAQEGYDIVLARRSNRQDAFLKRFTSRLFYQVLNYLADLNYDYQVGNFRIMSKKVVENFCMMREQLRFFGGLVDWMGFSTASVNVQHNARPEGRSTYTFRKLWKLAVDIIIAYSDKPLRLSVKVGFFIAFLAFIGGIYFLIGALLHGFAVVGWASLVISIYFLGGIIIANLGIIGIYLGKCFDETKLRPLYIVRNTTMTLERSSQPQFIKLSRHMMSQGNTVSLLLQEEQIVNMTDNSGIDDVRQQIR
jgi:dolichol-phosphate mannosyltransferase